MPTKPTIPAAGYSFTDHTASDPTAPQPGNSLDSELEQLRTSQEEILDWADTVIADDGDLRNAVVDSKHLSAEALAYLVSGWTPRGSWATATAYAVNDYIRDASQDGYVCVEAHTSGTFSTDVASGYWVQVNVAASTAGHTIKSEGSAQTIRDGLNFDGSFTLADDSGNDETDVALNFGTTAGVPAEGDHDHDADYAALVHTHDRDVVLNTGNYTVTAANHGDYIRISGDATISFSSALTLGAGFTCTIKSAGGTVVLNPSEAIDGGSSKTLAANDAAGVFCDGTAFYTAQGAAVTNVLTNQGEIIIQGVSAAEALAVGDSQQNIFSNGTTRVNGDPRGYRPDGGIQVLLGGESLIEITVNANEDILVDLFNLTGSADDRPVIQLYESGAYLTTTADYAWGYGGGTTASTNLGNADNSATYIKSDNITLDLTSPDYPAAIEFELKRAGDADYHTVVQSRVIARGNTNGDTRASHAMGVRRAAGAATKFKIYLDGGATFGANTAYAVYRRPTTEVA